MSTSGWQTDLCCEAPSAAATDPKRTSSGLNGRHAWPRYSTYRTNEVHDRIIDIARTDCGYTELYKGDTSTLGNVLDLFTA